MTTGIKVKIKGKDDDDAKVELNIHLEKEIELDFGGRKRRCQCVRMFEGKNVKESMSFAFDEQSNSYKSPLNLKRMKQSSHHSDLSDAARAIDFES